MRTRSFIGMAATTVAALTLAGCGGSSSPSVAPASNSTSSSTTSTTPSSAPSSISSSAAPTAESLVTQAKTTAMAQSSYRATGSISEKGGTMKFDIQSQSTGGNAQFTMDLSGDTTGMKEFDGAQINGTMTIRMVSAKEDYVKATQSFWKAALGSMSQGLSPSKVTAVSALMADKWIKDDGNNFSGVSDGMDLKSLLDGLDPSTATNLTVTPSSYLGKPAYLVSGTDKSDGSRTSLTILDDGKATLVKMTGTGISGVGSTGSITFSQWSKVPKFTAPPGALDLSQLASQAG